MAEQLQLAPNPESPGLARRFVAERMERWGLPDLIPDAVLMTSELATNAVIHVGQPFTVQVDNLGNGVRVTVIDASSDPATPRRTSLVETGGRGLHMVKAMATSSGVTLHGDSGKAVWFELLSDISRREAVPSVSAPERPRRTREAVDSEVTASLADERDASGAVEAYRSLNSAAVVVMTLEAIQRTDLRTEDERQYMLDRPLDHARLVMDALTRIVQGAPVDV